MFVIIYFSYMNPQDLTSGYRSSQSPVPFLYIIWPFLHSRFLSRFTFCDMLISFVFQLFRTCNSCFPRKVIVVRKQVLTHWDRQGIYNQQVLKVSCVLTKNYTDMCYLMSIYYVLDNVLNASHIWPLILSLIFCNRYYYTHYSEKEAEILAA